MNPVYWYWEWVIGSSDVTVKMSLNWTKKYLVTGGLTLTDDDDYAHVYISEICYYHGGDVVRCGIRDFSGDFHLSVHQFISDAISVTVKLKTKGGKHRAEGAVYEI